MFIQHQSESHKEDKKNGNLLKYKLRQKFIGTFVVTKVQTNDVTYEMKKVDNDTGIIMKAHHKQLGAWTEIPTYLKKFLNFGSKTESDSGKRT